MVCDAWLRDCQQQRTYRIRKEMQYGAYTPNGQRIALYPHPIVGVDALSLSLYQMIDEAVEVGKLEIPELECDEL